MISIEAQATSTGELYSVSITADAATIALMPKSARFTRWGQIMIQFAANGANGGANETGAKRVRALLKAAAKHSIGVVFDQPANVPDALNASLSGGVGSLATATHTGGGHGGTPG